MFLDGVRVFNPSGIPRSRDKPADLVNLTRHLSSKYTVISHNCLMNVIDEARKRVKSNAPGIGAGSLSTIEKVVHSLEIDASPCGSGPLRAKSYVYPLKWKIILQGMVDSPDPSCPSSRRPSIGLLAFKRIILCMKRWMQTS